MFFSLYRSTALYRRLFACFFFFNDTATTEIYTLSLHDALPILDAECTRLLLLGRSVPRTEPNKAREEGDRKSTRLNSSHLGISYAVFCLKKKKKKRKLKQYDIKEESDAA